MDKLKLGVVFGGMSTESEVSVNSAKSILENLDNNKYIIYPIYIDKDGVWYIYKNDDKYNNKIENIVEYLKSLDVVFPVLHGLYGEDGTIQGMLELLDIRYVGCKVLSSSIGMDKVYSKIVFDKAGLKQAKYEYIRRYNDKFIYIDKKFNEQIMNLKEVIKIINNNLEFPMFVKPSNSGSSVGVNKANNIKELEEFINEATRFDNKILIEEGINGREVECAVLGNEEVISSCVGEVKPSGNFYSYDSKYINNESKTDIPANIDDVKSQEIQKLAIKAFKAIDGKGLSRVDFFIENNTNDIYINEINTLPGFTNISMYPKLFECIGINYSNILDKLIELALE